MCVGVCVWARVRFARNRKIYDFKKSVLLIIYKTTFLEIIHIESFTNDYNNKKVKICLIKDISGRTSILLGCTQMELP